jgi:hypothetical protein
LLAGSFNRGLLLGLFISISISQIVSYIFSLSVTLTFGVMLSILIVWLDAFSTDLGLKLGFEESNKLIRFLQNAVGFQKGLILSRILPSAIILYCAVTLETPYILFIISSIFMFCHIRNLVNILGIQVKRNFAYL